MNNLRDSHIKTISNINEACKLTDLYYARGFKIMTENNLSRNQVLSMFTIFIEHLLETQLKFSECHVLNSSHLASIFIHDIKEKAVQEKETDTRDDMFKEIREMIIMTNKQLCEEAMNKYEGLNAQANKMIYNTLKFYFDIIEEDFLSTLGDDNDFWIKGDEFNLELLDNIRIVTALCEYVGKDSLLPSEFLYLKSYVLNELSVGNKKLANKDVYDMLDKIKRGGIEFIEDFDD